MIIPNAISPFSVPLDYLLASKKGLICFPHKASALNGWGEPWKTPEGVTIFPGTKDGPMPNVLLYYREPKATEFGPVPGEYKRRVGKEVQGVGPIDWWGPDKKVSAPNKKHIVSFWGPSSRYFANSTFSYGSDRKHNEIYYEGRIAAIAPYPVTGACMQPIADTPNKWWIVAVVSQQGGEHVYRREMGVPYLVSTITEDLRQQLQAPYYFDSNPTGWRYVGKVSGPDYTFKADSPWFFNQSGTEALAIRRREITFDSGSGNVTEIRNEVYKIVVSTTDGKESSGYITCTKHYAPDAYLYSEVVKKHNSGVWESPPDGNGVVHLWQEDYATVEIEFTGRQPAAVDYYENQPIIADLVLNGWHLLHEDWMIGVDPVEVLNHNTGQLQNYQPGSYTNVPRGHRTSTWTNIDNSTYLEWTVGTTKYQCVVEGSLDYTRLLYATKGQYLDEGDKIRYYVEHSRAYVRYMDLRVYLAQARVEKYEEFNESGFLRYRVIDSEGADNAATDSQSGSTTFSSFLESNPPKTVSAVAQGWGRTAMTGWQADFEYTWTKTTYIGKRPTDNDSGAKGSAYPQAFYDAAWTTIKDGWKGLELFRHKYFTTKAGFGQTPDGHFLMSLTIPDVSTTAQTESDWAVVSTGLNPITLTSTERLYPIGVA